MLTAIMVAIRAKGKKPDKRIWASRIDLFSRNGASNDHPLNVVGTFVNL